MAAQRQVKSVRNFANFKVDNRLELENVECDMIPWFIRGHTANTQRVRYIIAALDNSSGNKGSFARPGS